MKQRTWKKLWARKYAPYIASSYILMYQTRRGLNQLQNKLFLPDGNLHAFYVDEDEFEKLIMSVNNFLLKQKIKNFAIKYEDHFRQLRKFGLSLKKHNFEKNEY